MTFGYYIDAIDAARKDHGAVQTSASHVERKRYPKATLPLVLAR
jgi:hypothetical protein